MHPGPMNEGVEIAPEVAHGLRSVVEEQVTNGVAVRMAILLPDGDGEAAMSAILIRGGRVIDPSSGRDEQGDVLIEDGTVRAVGGGVDAQGAGCRGRGGVHRDAGIRRPARAPA